ncbi:MAG: NADH:flavin oxidoreductase/NADH oxidase, partial [Rhodomicrobiaceae bacterium]
MSRSNPLPVSRPAGGQAGQRAAKTDANPYLFQPPTFRSVTSRNSAMLSPMCEYSAKDGVANDWHLVHLGARAIGGVGIVSTEATHVEERGRITHGCLGLWNDTQRDALAPVAAFVAQQGAIPAVQLAHAGRKASTDVPWRGGKPLTPEQGAWQPIGPSPLAFGPNYAVPREMTAEDIQTVLDAFAAAARRALQAGFRIIELHSAHGYLGHSFLSPISNKRTDRYGGGLENRARFLLDLVAAVRAEWPDHLPLFVRLSCADWVEGGLTIEDTVNVARMLKATGAVDLIDCSSGGVDPGQKIELYPGYQVPFAARIRREAGIATAAVGLIHSPDFAESILASGAADLIVLGRALMANPHWVLGAAKTLKADVDLWP